MDDSPLILEAAREALEDAGFTVQTASNIAEFERSIGAPPLPDLVILDVEMPEMFGDHVATVLRHIRGLEMPIYLFSTRSEADLQSRVAEAQVDGYISKDDGIDGLVRRVKTILKVEGQPPATSGKAKPKHRVVVVDDSSLARRVLIEVLEADGDIEVVGEAEDGYKALECVGRLKPDVVTIDVSMPGIDGLQTLSWIMAKCPVPVLLVTEEPVASQDVQLAFEAMQRGAVDLIPKTFGTLREVGEKFREMVRRAAWTPVFLREGGPNRDTVPPSESARHLVAKFIEEERTKITVIGLAGGIGGAQVVTRTLSQLPMDLKCAVLVTQPIPGGYEASYAQFLRAKIALPVAVVTRDGMDCTPGTVFFAGEDAHLVVVSPGRVTLQDGPRENGCRPSADVLFRSMAQVYGDRALGVVLSGRGRDGTSGILALRERGGRTLAELPESASPNEMPSSALASGAVEHAVEARLLADAITTIAGPPTSTRNPPASARSPWASPQSRQPPATSKPVSKSPSMSIAGRPPPSSRSPSTMEIAPRAPSSSRSPSSIDIARSPPHESKSPSSTDATPRPPPGSKQSR
jgi:two-component system chemotaxis response regulator CheB